MYKQVLVDIILPVLNRFTLTEQTIKSLFDATDIQLFNLYVIDDGSSEGASALVDNLRIELLEKYNKAFKLLKNDVAVGPGAAKNQLADFITKNHLRSPYLYFSDNDVFFKLGWLETLTDLFQKANVTIAANKLKLLGASCHPFLHDNTSFGFEYNSQRFKIGIKDAVSGYSQLMRWETWDEFGPFDEGSRGLEEKTGRSEDWAFCRKIVEAGFLVGAIEPELVIPCGKTNTYGKPAVGQETFKNYEGIKVQ